MYKCYTCACPGSIYHTPLCEHNGRPGSGRKMKGVPDEFLPESGSSARQIVLVRDAVIL